MNDATVRSPGIPLKMFLTRLIWLCVLPLLILGLWLTYDSVRATLERRDQEALHLAKNFALSIDLHLRSRVRALNMLAFSPAMDDRSRWKDLYQEAQGFRESFGSHVILADAEGPMQMLFNTRVPYGDPLPVLPRPKGHAAAPAAVATMKPAVGDTFIGPVANATLVAIAAPVVRENRVVRLLLTTYEAKQFQDRLDEFSLPEDWIMTLLDGRGDVIARRGPENETMTRGVSDSGRIVIKSTISPWSVTLEIPRHARLEPLLKTGFTVGAGLLVATLASFLGGAAASRRLSRDLARLTRHEVDDGVAEIAEIAAVQERLGAASTELRESEERFRRLFYDAPVPMGQVGKDGLVLAQNDRFVHLFGYSIEDIPSIDAWWRFAYPDPDYRAEVMARWDAAVERAVAHGSDIEAGEYRVTCKDGSERIVRISGIVMDGGALSTFFDVTELRRAETRLRLWVEAFEHAELGLVIVDARTNIVIAANPAFARTRGYDRAEMSGMPVQRLFAPDKNADVRDMVATLDASTHVVFESEHVTKDGRRFPVLLDVTVLRDDDGRPVSRIAYALDLTERKRVEQALTEAQAAALDVQNRARIAALNQMQDANAARARAEEALAALRESEEQIRQLNAELEARVEERTAQLVAANKELEAFSYSVSHDLRAPLRAITGFSRILLEDHAGRLDEDGKRVCAVISDSARDMGKLIDDLLTFSRTGRAAINPALIDMAALATSVYFEQTTEESRDRLDFQVGDLPLCLGDPALVRQLWVNLLSNAIKFSSRKDKAEIRIEARQSEDGTVYGIKDNGAGFDMRYADKLFGVFQRLHSARDFEGTGVGLAIVQRIVQRHGGRIWAESEAGQGAAFYFTLGKESVA